MVPQYHYLEGEYPPQYPPTFLQQPQQQMMLAPPSQPQPIMYGSHNFPQTHSPGEWSGSRGVARRQFRTNPTIPTQAYSNPNPQQPTVNQGSWSLQHNLDDQTYLQKPLNIPSSDCIPQVTSSGYHSFPPTGFSYDSSRKDGVGGPSTTAWSSSSYLSGTGDHFDGHQAERTLPSRSPPSLVYKTEPDHSPLEGEATHSSPNSTWEGSDTTQYARVKRCSSFEYELPYSNLPVLPSQQDPGTADFTSAPYFHNNQIQQWNQTDWTDARSFVSWPATDLAKQPISGYPETNQGRNNLYLQSLEGDPVPRSETTQESRTKNAQSTSNPVAQTASHARPPLHQVRKKEDHILLEGKRRGLTYKEIRKKLGTDVAESTLRGRYRSLTKARKDRVRKPVWTENDVCITTSTDFLTHHSDALQIRLLQQIVLSELHRLSGPCYRQTTEEQRLAKISWKRVAEYIKQHGGSYHFGNSTCKKKWTELVEAGNNA